MKWMLAAFVVLTLSVVIVILIGGRMPRDHVATVRAKYRAAPSVIWPLISNPAEAMSWRHDLKSVDILPSVNGLPAWREHSKGGSTSFVMSEQHAPTSQITRIADEQLPFGGQWEFTLTPSGTGSELTITERGFVKPALFRFLARTVFGFTDSLEQYHRSLAAKLGENVTVNIVTTGR